MRAPDGLIEIKALYGDPLPLVKDDGTVSILWEYRMSAIALPGPVPLGWMPSVKTKTARFNQAIGEEVERVFYALRACGAWDHVVTFDGAYTWRSKRDSKKLSMHAYGGAVDFNAATNKLGTEGDMHPLIVQAFESHGWTWGGRWSRPDPMHFQWGRGY